MATYNLSKEDRRYISRIQYEYGITPHEYVSMLKEQKSCCLFCKEWHPSDAKNNRLHIDHDHETGRVRGLLCRRCNVAVGYTEILIKEIGIEGLLSYLQP